MTLAPVASATSASEITLLDYWKWVDTPTVRVVLAPQQTETLTMARTRVARADASAWQELTRQFVDRLKDLDPTAQVWSLPDENCLTLVTGRDELDHELALHAVWVDLSRGRFPAATGALVVETTAEAAKASTLGERLV